MVTQDLIALAERVEQATEPSRELDAQIGRYAPHLVAFLGGVPDEPQSGCIAFTASIDAALTLVPSGLSWNAQQLEDMCRAQVGNRAAYADTPALAICAAALRARASL